MGGEHVHRATLSTDDTTTQIMLQVYGSGKIQFPSIFSNTANIMLRQEGDLTAKNNVGQQRG